MPIRERNRTLLRGLSDFWQRFFADSDQLDALYGGTEILLGQSYLDLLSNVLSTNLVDCPIFNKEYWKLITIREDEVKFKKGPTSSDDRWVYELPESIVKITTLENKIIEPTASLQGPQDFDLIDKTLEFKVDPLDPLLDGLPTKGFASRKLLARVGGEFHDGNTISWLLRNIKKGDIIRLLDIRPTQQVKVSDHVIDVLRKTSAYVNEDTPFTAAQTNLSYVVLRQPSNYQIFFEDLFFSTPQNVITVLDAVNVTDTKQVNLNPVTSESSRVGYASRGVSYFSVAQLAHLRIVKGSVRVYAKNLNGEDVKENVDYVVDYEAGKVYKLRAWGSGSTNKIDYQWLQEVWPSVGVPPRYSTGGISSTISSIEVTQIACWAPDVLVDRKTLAANFGSLINQEAESSEDYRAFLRGIFQLYILGPVLERIESALNVVLGLPVIRDDDEILLSYDNSDPMFQRVLTTRSNGTIGLYDFPKATPLRTDVTDALNYGTLAFKSFEHLSTAATVTDYIQDPTWWHRIVIPPDLFSDYGDAEIPDVNRRSVSPQHFENIIGSIDDVRIGDPGFFIGADEEGTVPPPTSRVYKRKMSFVLMDRFLKRHMFFVKFHESVFITTDAGVQFARTPDELRKIIFEAKPAHTYPYLQPSTLFVDTVIVAEDNYYQPQRFLGADVDSSEIRIEGDLVVGEPSVLLGLFLQSTVPPTNNVLFADRELNINTTAWRIGDYFRYEMFTENINFVGLGAIALANAPIAPRVGRAVRVYVDGLIGGKKLIENVDYSVNYSARTVSRITAWDSNTVNVTYIQLNIGNIVDMAPSAVDGDHMYLIGALEPELICASYNATALDMFLTPIPITNHKDLSLVERAVIIKQTP